MKKVIALVAAVMCLLCVFAFAEAEGFTGAWINGAGNYIYELREDGTANSYEPESGVIVEANWTADVEILYNEVFFNRVRNNYMYYEADSDALISIIKGEGLTRLSDEEFESIKADMASRAVLDVTMEDFCGEWTFSHSVNRENPDLNAVKGDYYFEIDLTVSEDGFSIKPGSYAMGMWFGDISNADCAVYGNRLQIAVDEYSSMYLQKMADGTLLFTGSPRVHYAFQDNDMYLERAE